MLRDIGAFRARFDALPSSLVRRIRELVTLGEAVAFVLNCNRLELVGTQGEAETRELCLDAIERSRVTEKKALETRQTFEALQLMHTLYEEKLAECVAQGCPAHYALMLTPDLIRQVHGRLMADLVKNAGQYRRNDAYPEGCAFFYTQPDRIENEMLAWTDWLNDCIASSSGVDLLDSFKLAALALFHTVNVHPFSDGNGRLCHIVGSNLLRPFHFFPVYIQPCTGAVDHARWRAIYIDAIEACRRHPEHRPEDLAALLIESSWAAWRRIHEVVCEWSHEGHALIGAIVLRAVTADLQADRIRERWPTLAHDRRDADADEADDLRTLRAAAEAGDKFARLSDGAVVVLIR